MSCDRATAALRWFIYSGIQDQSGGVARYYRADLGKNARVSTEITGYAVSSLTYLHRRTGDENALRAARRAAGFLMSTAWDPVAGIFPFEYSANGDAPEPLVYFFDSGIIVRGLLALYRATGESAYLDAAIRGGESMLRYFRPGKVIPPVLRLPSADPLPYTSQWSRSPGCYQLKSAMAWYNLGVETAEARFTESYELVLESALATHRTFLPADTPEKTMDRLHAYLYFLEGLMPVAERPNVVSALREGISAVSQYLSDIRTTFERSDVYAQLLRVRLLAAKQAGIAVDCGNAEAEAKTIPSFQAADTSDVRLRGGYCFGRRAGAMIPHANPVSTAFCSQALEMWRDYSSGQKIDLESLI